MTGPAWALAVGCGACLALALVMTVFVIHLGSVNHKLALKNKSLAAMNEELLEANDVLRGRSQVTSPRKRKREYLIKEEEFV